jgi:hypothetical protein
MSTRFTRPLICSLSLIGAGCSQNVQVETTFPEPLVEPLPVTVGVFYNERLTGYSYTEELPADSMDWTFDIGSANQLLFESIFGEVFLSARPVETNTARGVTAVLEPNIEAFEFSLPRHSGTNQYGVWIKYSIDVYAPDGELRTNWPVKGYGEVDSQRFKGNETMRQATVLAMRDAATIIIESLNRDTAFRRAVLGPTEVPETEAASAEVITIKKEPGETTPEVGRVEEDMPELTGEEPNGES